VMAAASNEGHLRIWRVMGSLALTPGDVAAFIRLARRYRVASRSLAAVARVGSLTSHAFPAAPDAGVS